MTWQREVQIHSRQHWRNNNELLDTSFDMRTCSTPHAESWMQSLTEEVPIPKQVSLRRRRSQVIPVRQRSTESIWVRVDGLRLMDKAGAVGRFHAVQFIQIKRCITHLNAHSNLGFRLFIHILMLTSHSDNLIIIYSFIYYEPVREVQYRQRY